MSWLADNVTAIYVLLAIITAGLVFIWRSNQQLKFLFYAAGVLALLAIVWLAVRYVPTDRHQLEGNVRAMADAVVDGKVNELLKHVSKDFNYKGMTREKLSVLAQQSVRTNRVREVRISGFSVDELSRVNKVAKTSFLVTVWGDKNDQFLFRTQADFVLEGEQWRLVTMRFYPVIGGQDQEIDLSGIH
jgi:hypothetical protein